MKDLQIIIHIFSICINICACYILFNNLKKYRKSFDVDIQFLKERKDDIKKLDSKIDSLSISYKYLLDIHEKHGVSIKDIENKINSLEVHVFNVMKSSLYNGNSKIGDNKCIQ